MNALTIEGHPTMGGTMRAIGSGGGVNQSLANQAAWFIDPINGSDSRSGKTLATAIQTKREFVRRMFGVQLTQSITVTITSDLIAGDNATPLIFGNVSAGFSVNYVGTPVVLHAGSITAKVNRNGATSTVTQVTDSALPVSWTASGLVGKTIEFDAGGGVIIRGVVVADLGAKTAWISPPLLSTTSLETTVTVGQTYNVYQLTDFGSPQVIGGFNTFKYLTTTTRWMCEWGRNDFVSCGGSFLATVHGGTVGIQNHTTFGNTNLNFGVNMAGRGKITGGYIALDLACAHVEINQSTTFLAITAENNSVLTTAFLGTQPDVEFNSIAGITAPIRMNISGARVIFTGFVYGTSSPANLVLFDAADSHVHFKNQPNVTGATTIVGSFAGVTELLSRLTKIEYNDYFNNRVLGPAGPQLEMDRSQNFLSSRGILAETLPFFGQQGSSILIAGVAYYIGVGLRAGDLISTIDLIVAVASGTSTISLVGLYNKAGTRIAVSADQGASWQTAGLKSINVITPVTIPTTDVYYIGIFAAVSAGALPTLNRGLTAGGINATPQYSLGGNPAWGYVQTGQATLPSPATFADTAAVTNIPAFWFQVR